MLLIQLLPGRPSSPAPSQKPNNIDTVGPCYAVVIDSIKSMCTWKSYLKTWMRNQFPSIWSPFVSSNMDLCLSVCRNEMLIAPSRRFRTAYIRNDAILSSLGMDKLTTPSRRPPLQEMPTYGHIHWDPQWWLPNTPQKQQTPYPGPL